MCSFCEDEFCHHRVCWYPDSLWSYIRCLRNFTDSQLCWKQFIEPLWRIIWPPWPCKCSFPTTDDVLTCDLYVRFNRRNGIYAPWVIHILREQGLWGKQGAHLGPAGPRWAPCWHHEPCYQGIVVDRGHFGVPRQREYEALPDIGLT